MDDFILVNDNEFFLHDIKFGLSHTFEMIDIWPHWTLFRNLIMNNVTNHSIHLSLEKYFTYILKCFGIMDYKPDDIPLPTRQKFTKKMGPKDLHETNLMKTIPYVKQLVASCMQWQILV